MKLMRAVVGSGTLVGLGLMLGWASAASAGPPPCLGTPEVKLRAGGPVVRVFGASAAQLSKAKARLVTGSAPVGTTCTGDIVVSASTGESVTFSGLVFQLEDFGPGGKHSFTVPAALCGAKGGSPEITFKAVASVNRSVGGTASTTVDKDVICP